MPCHALANQSPPSLALPCHNWPALQLCALIYLANLFEPKTNAAKPSMGIWLSQFPLKLSYAIARCIGAGVTTKALLSSHCLSDIHCCPWLGRLNKGNAVGGRLLVYESKGMRVLFIVLMQVLIGVEK